MSNQILNEVPHFDVDGHVYDLKVEKHPNDPKKIIDDIMLIFGSEPGKLTATAREQSFFGNMIKKVLSGADLDSFKTKDNAGVIDELKKFLGK